MTSHIAITIRVRFRAGGAVTGGLLALILAGCQQKMAEQPSYKPLSPAGFFDDGRSARPIVAGTVARGHLKTDRHLETGLAPLDPAEEAAQSAAVEGSNAGALTKQELAELDFVDTFPFPITKEIVDFGGERYRIYCIVCHDPLGTGKGQIVERGFTTPPSYHIARLRDAPVGHLFAVISRGYGSMPSHASQIPARDRWAIVAYVRALQLSQHFPVAELTSEMKQELQGNNRPGTAP